MIAGGSALRAAPLRQGRVRRSACRASAQLPPSNTHVLTRRVALQWAGVAVVLGTAGPSTAAGVAVLSDEPGIGKHALALGDLIIVHYVGTLAEGGQVFDSTRGGLMYRDGGPGVNRPLTFKLGGYPVTGVVKGLQEGMLGMTIGGKRSIEVPPELGFGAQPVAAPYALVPAGSTLRYDIELLRLSTRGPDDLTRGLARCGQGGAGAAADGCGGISFFEAI